MILCTTAGGLGVDHRRRWTRKRSGEASPQHAQCWVANDLRDLREHTRKGRELWPALSLRIHAKRFFRVHVLPRVSWLDSTLPASCRDLDVLRWEIERDGKGYRSFVCSVERIRPQGWRLPGASMSSASWPASCSFFHFPSHGHAFWKESSRSFSRTSTAVTSTPPPHCSAAQLRRLSYPTLSVHRWHGGRTRVRVGSTWIDTQGLPEPARMGSIVQWTDCVSSPVHLGLSAKTPRWRTPLHPQQRKSDCSTVSQSYPERPLFYAVTLRMILCGEQTQPVYSSISVAVRHRSAQWPVPRGTFVRIRHTRRSVPVGTIVDREQSILSRALLSQTALGKRRRRCWTASDFCSIWFWSSWCARLSSDWNITSKSKNGGWRDVRFVRRETLTPSRTKKTEDDEAVQTPPVAWWAKWARVRPARWKPALWSQPSRSLSPSAFATCHSRWNRTAKWCWATQRVTFVRKRWQP